MESYLEFNSNPFKNQLFRGMSLCFDKQIRYRTGMPFIFYYVHGARRLCVSRYIRLAWDLTAGKLRTDVAQTPAVVARHMNVHR